MITTRNGGVSIVAQDVGSHEQTGETLARLLRESETRHFPGRAGGRLRESSSFPRKRESTSLMKVSGFPLSSRFRGNDGE